MQGLARLTHPLVVVAAVCFVTPATAAPTKAKKLVKQVVALVPATADGNVAKAQLETIDRALANSAGQHADVVAVRSLDKRTGKGSFPVAVKACRGDGPCLSKLARATKVEVIVVPAAKADSDGITVTTAVAGANETIHRVSFTFATAADLNAAIAKNAGELFSSGQTTDEPALESLAALPLEPLENPAATATPATTTPTATPVPIEPPTVAKVDTTPAAEAKLDVETPRRVKGKNKDKTPAVAAVTEPTAPPPVQLDVVSMPLGTTQTMPRPARTHSYGWGAYAGAGVAAVGIAGITYGVVEYLQHKNIVNTANGDPTLTQREAASRDQDAKTKYDHSRIGLYAGVPLLVAGAGLIIWDIAIADHNTSAAAEPDNHLKLSVLPDLSGGFYSSAVLTW